MPYIKECFDVVTFEQAKHVVLSNEPDKPDKFEKETGYLVDTISKQEFIKIDDNSVVLDFGCGMGRVSKEIIKQFNCKVIGLDISPSMLMFAKLYISNVTKFETTQSYSMPNSIDMAMSILALQHSEDPKKEIDNIFSVLKPGGMFVLLNETNRLVPDDIDSHNYIVWKDDGFNVFEYVESKLSKIHSTPYLDSKKEIIFYRKNNE
jgi:ubiquinone/menaquinone biosynthesis C-methylase UbiE